LATVLVAAYASPPALAGRSQAVEPSTTVVRPGSQTQPPAQHLLSAREAIRIAGRSPRLRKELTRHRQHRVEAYTNGRRRWQVSYYAGGDEVAQAIVTERPPKVVEVWTGPQVDWQMARGLPGAFGKKVNAPYIWIPLMVAFVAPFIDRRRPFRLLHLDLLVLLSFSVSHLYFNKGEIFTSVPLVYPVLVYLLARMLLFAYSRRFRDLQAPLEPLIPVSYLALGLIFLIGFRIGLNLTNSNVIDVGYSGVIGADHITHGHAIYANFPQDNASGDTYGPVTYLAYVPFELLFPWSGTWDSLPAAHAAALFFDSATILGLFLVGRRLAPGGQGRNLGLALAYAWAAYPYTLFVLNSNANDALVAMLVVYCFLFVGSSRMRGSLAALAGAAKFAPLALVPLQAGYSRTRLTAVRFALAFLLVAAVAMLPVLLGGGVSKFWERTVGFQLGRDSPFSIWGQNDSLRPVQDVVKVLAVAIALFVAFLPRHKTPLQTAALGAAVLIAFELCLSHWFYLYIVWFLPLVLIALITAVWPSSEADTGDPPTERALPGGLHDELDRAGQPALG
jgi:hypothetical protein